MSLVVTVKDEAGSIGALLDSIAAQTRRPDEVVIVDGGSTDGTPDIVREHAGRLPIRLLCAPGATISEGRNLGISHARGEIIAVADAGVRLDPRWLEEITAPFLRHEGPRPDVVSGFFRADPQSLFELALGATTLPDEEEIRADRFLPSSRSVAFLRSWYEAGIRYPQWLDYCEDLIFDLRLREAGARFEFVPRAFVWFRPRSNLRAFWRQYYLYARGDGKAGLFARRHLIRYGTYGVFLPLAVLARRRWLAALAGLGAVAYMRRPWLRLWRRRREVGPLTLLRAAALAPFLRLVGDLAKMTGYPAGLVWRARRYRLRWSWRRIPEEGNSAGGADALAERVPEELGRP